MLELSLCAASTLVPDEYWHKFQEIRSNLLLV